METKEKDIIEIFHNNLNILLQKNHVSMRTLSLDIGKSESYIQKVMDNKMNPTLDTLSDIARYFEIPFTSLFSQETHSMEFRLIEDKLIKLSANELTFLMQIIDIVLKMKSIEE